MISFPRVRLTAVEFVKALDRSEETLAICERVEGSVIKSAVVGSSDVWSCEVMEWIKRGDAEAYLASKEPRDKGWGIAVLVIATKEVVYFKHQNECYLRKIEQHRRESN